MSDRVYLGRNAKKVSVAKTFEPYTKVVVIVGEGEEQLVYEAGDNSGRTLEVKNPWGTQTIANSILAQIKGYAYQPYNAIGALLDPAAELGDGVTVSGVYSVLATQEITFGPLAASSIAAPEGEETDQEYPYISKAMRNIQRRINTATATLKVEINSITAEVKDVNGHLTRVEQTANKIDWVVSGDSQSNFSITDKAATLIADKLDIQSYVTFTGLETGTTVINGGCIKTGTLEGDTIKAGTMDGQAIKAGTLQADRISSKSGSLVPVGGKDGQYLVKSGSEGVWQDLPHELPSGGSDGQVLVKSGSTNYSVKWATLSIPGTLPTGGSKDQVLAKGSGTNYDCYWKTLDVNHDLPSGGSDGQVLMKSGSTNYSVKWATLSVSGTLPAGGLDGQMLIKSGYKDYSVAWTSSFGKAGGLVGFFGSAGYAKQTAKKANTASTATVATVGSAFNALLDILKNYGLITISSSTI